MLCGLEDVKIILGHTAAGYVLWLEKKALGSNYGFPRDIVMFPERKKLIRTGWWWDGHEPTIDSFSGDVRFDDGSFVEKTDSKANMHFGLEDEYGERRWLFSLESKTITILEGRKRAIAKHVDLPESVIDEDTIYEHCAVHAGSETQTINFGEITSGILPEWIEPCVGTVVFPEFAIKHSLEHMCTIVTDRSYKTYHYCRFCTFGHCAIGAVQFDYNVYNIYWHVGKKRFYVGQYDNEIFAIKMLSWRVFIIMPSNEFCYIGEN